METFKHKFFGRQEADAYFHINPDGSKGAVVAVGAHIAAGLTLDATIEVGPHASIFPHVSIGRHANIGPGANIGTRASIGPYVSIGPGANIGTRASIGDGASIGPGANIGTRASIGDGASIGPGASIGDGEWFMSVGPQGSRNATLTAVQTKDGLRWWVGCKMGITTEDLRGHVAKTHGGNDHAADYLHVIAFVEGHPGRLRNEAERASTTLGE